MAGRTLMALTIRDVGMPTDLWETFPESVACPNRGTQWLPPTLPQRTGGRSDGGSSTRLPTKIFSLTCTTNGWTALIFWTGTRTQRFITASWKSGQFVQKLKELRCRI